MAISKLRTLEGRLIVSREVARRLAADIRNEHETLVLQIIAGDAECIWTAKMLADVLAADNVRIEPGDLLVILEGNVRNKRLKRIAEGYQFIRPGVLESITRGRVA